MPLVAYVLEAAVGFAYLLAFVLRLTCWRVFFSSCGLEPSVDQIKWFNRNFKNRVMPPWLYGVSILWVCHADWFMQALLIIGAISGLGALLHIHTYWCIGTATLIYASLQSMHSNGFPVGGHRILANVGFVMFMSWVCGASDENMLVLIRTVYVLIMFYSGLTKEITDKGWSKLLHMDYHYWTQPLPTILGFWLNRMPHWFHAASTFASLAIELTSPVLASWNAYTRLLSFLACNGLVVMINTCGNFGFFGFPLYIASISFFDDKDIAILTSGFPTFTSLLSPDFAWLTSLSTTEQVCLFLYVALSSYVAVQAFPANFAAFFDSDAWYHLPVHVLLGSFLYSPYFFYWTSPKRRHEGVIEVRATDGKWHEIHFKHGSGILDKLSPITGGFWETTTAITFCWLGDARMWKEGTPLVLRHLLQGMTTGDTRFNSIFDAVPPLPITAARLKVYDYRFVGTDRHKLWRLHEKLGGQKREQLGERYVTGEHPSHYWKRELLAEEMIDFKSE